MLLKTISVFEEKPWSQVLVSLYWISGSLDLHLWRLCQWRVWSLAAVPDRDMPSYCYGNRQAHFRHAVCSDALCEMMVQVWPPAGSHHDANNNDQMCSHKVWHHTETWIRTLYNSSIFRLIKLRQPPSLRCTHEVCVNSSVDCPLLGTILVQIESIQMKPRHSMLLHHTVTYSAVFLFKKTWTFNKPKGKLRKAHAPAATPHRLHKTLHTHNMSRSQSSVI